MQLPGCVVCLRQQATRVLTSNQSMQVKCTILIRPIVAYTCQRALALYSFSSHREPVLIRIRQALPSLLLNEAKYILVDRVILSLKWVIDAEWISCIGFVLCNGLCKMKSLYAWVGLNRAYKLPFLLLNDRMGCCWKESGMCALYFKRKELSDFREWGFHPLLGQSTRQLPCYHALACHKSSVIEAWVANRGTVLEQRSSTTSFWVEAIRGKNSLIRQALV